MLWQRYLSHDVDFLSMYPLLLEEVGSAAVFALGILALYGGVAQYRKKRVMRDTPTSKVRSLALGPVEIKGKPEKYEESFESPFSGKECVMYVYSVDVYKTGGPNSSGGWSTVEAGVKAAPFYVNDGTGRVLVDPDGAEKEPPVTNSYEYTDEKEDEEIRRFMSESDSLFENTTDVGITGMAEFATATDLRMGDADLLGSGRKRRYEESYLPLDSDTDVYVFGRAMGRKGVSSPDNPENIVISRTEDTPLFKISGSSEKENISGASNLSRNGAVFGFVFTVVGFAATLYTAGWIWGIVLLGLGAYGAYLFNEKFTLNKDAERAS